MKPTIIKKLESIYQYLYADTDTSLSDEIISKFQQIEAKIGRTIPQDIKLFIINETIDFDIFFYGKEKLQLAELTEMYSKINYKDKKISDFTSAWKLDGVLQNDFTINSEDSCFCVYKDSAIIKELNGQDLSDTDFEENYDLSAYLPIYEFQGDYTFVDLSDSHNGRILDYFYEDSTIYEVAPSLKTHLKDLMEKIATDKYKVAPSTGEVELPENWYLRNK